MSPNDPRQRGDSEAVPDYPALARRAATAPERPICPDANVLYLGGSSIVDRGLSALKPLIDEIVEARRDHGFKIVVGIGGGIRTQHVHMIAQDLSLPTGLKALLAGGGEEQALRVVVSLLLPVGGCPMNRDSPLNYPLYLEQGLTPVIIGSPLHHHWEPPARYERHVDCGPDYGLLNLAEMLSARSMIFVKDVDGVCSADPRRASGTTLIPRIGVEELLREGPETLPLERAAIEAFRCGRRLREIRVINGLKRGTLLRALRGDEVGTRIVRDDEEAS